MHPLVDQVGDAVGQDSGLAGAGARHDEQRPIGVDDGVELVRVQPVGREIGRRRVGEGRVGHLATHPTKGVRGRPGRRCPAPSGRGDSQTLIWARRFSNSRTSAPSSRQRRANAAIGRRRARSDVVEHAVERAGHVVEIERVDQHRGVVDLAAALGAHEPPELGFDAPALLCGLTLERAERPEVALRGDRPVPRAATPSARMSSSSRSSSHTKNPSVSMSARVRSAPSPARSSARWNDRSSPASQRPASGTSKPRGPNSSTKRPIVVAPPIGTSVTPSASRSRPRRTASRSRARWSLTPSTSTTILVSSISPTAPASQLGWARIPLGSCRRRADPSWSA